MQTILYRLRDGIFGLGLAFDFALLAQAGPLACLGEAAVRVTIQKRLRR